MTQILPLLSQYGIGAVLFAVLVYVLLRGELSFRYPRPPKDR